MKNPERLYAIEIRNETHPATKLFGFPLDPINVNITLTPSVQLTQTMSDTVREFSDSKLGEINITGETGLLKRRGYNKKGNIVYKTSLDLFYELQALVDDYLSNSGDITIKDNVRFIFHNFQDDKHYYCEPINFQITRDQTHKIALSYQMQFKFYGYAQYKSGKDGIFDKMIKGVESVVDAVTDFTDDYITSNIAMVNKYLTDINDLLNYTKNISAAIGRIGFELNNTNTTLSAIIKFPESFWNNLKINLAKVTNSLADLVSTVTFSDNDYEEFRTLWDTLNVFSEQEQEVDNLSVIQQAIQSGNDYVLIKIYAGQDLADICLKKLGSLDYLQDIIDLNNLIPPYITTTGEKGTLKAGDFLLVPKDIIGKNAQSDINKINETKLYGTDLRLDNDDLIIESGDDPQDIQLISGYDNLEQAVLVKLKTKRGDNLVFPEIGLSFSIGSPMLFDAATVVTVEIINQLKQDDRIKAVSDFVVEDIDGGIGLSFSVELKTGRKTQIYV